jgi:diacylglycerol kinase
MVLPPNTRDRESARSAELAEMPVGSPRRRPWRDKFRAAFRGLKLGVRGHSSFSVHLFFTVLVAAAAIVLRCSPVEWCLLLGCIGIVLTAELFNSALETLLRGLDETTKMRVWPCLDIAAGAVLLASLFAVLIGCIIFVPLLIKLLG